jgi:hypothetical protein
MNERRGTGKATEKESGQRARSGGGGGPHRQHHRAVDQDTRDFFIFLLRG